MEITHNNHGFTLLETLVSISVVATVGVLIAQVFFTTTRSNKKTELLKDVKQNGDFAMELMDRTIQNSLGITSECSSSGTTLPFITLRNADGNISELGCVADASVTRIASTSAESGKIDYLTSANVTIGGTTCDEDANTLHFTCLSNIDQPPQITIQFRMTQRGTPVDQFEKASIEFQTTVTPRN